MSVKRAALAVVIFGIALGEESSVLDYASAKDMDINMGDSVSHSAQVLIDGSFKTYTVSIDSG